VGQGSPWGQNQGEPLFRDMTDDDTLLNCIVFFRPAVASGQFLPIQSWRSCPVRPAADLGRIVKST
jgi:hypothetical protein